MFGNFMKERPEKIPQMKEIVKQPLLKISNEEGLISKKDGATWEIMRVQTAQMVNLVVGELEDSVRQRRNLSRQFSYEKLVIREPQ